MDLNQIIQIALADEIDQADEIELGELNLEEILRGCLTNYRSSIANYKKTSLWASLKKRKPISHLREDMGHFMEKLKTRKAKVYDSLFSLPSKSSKRQLTRDGP